MDKKLTRNQQCALVAKVANSLYHRLKLGQIKLTVTSSKPGQIQCSDRPVVDLMTILTFEYVSCVSMALYSKNVFQIDLFCNKEREKKVL